MAKYNEILVGRYNRFMQKLFSMKGSASVSQLAGEIVPSFSFFSGAEHRYLEGWNRFGQEVNNTAGGVGNFGQVRLRNPTNSNVVVVVEKLTVSNNNAGTELPSMFLGVQAADLASLASLTAARFDPRGNPQPTAIMSFKNNSALATYGLNKWAVGMTTNSSVEVITTDIQEFPLLPGDAFDIANGVANQALVVSMWWRERFLEESERT